MSGIGALGREVIWTVSGQAIAGVQTKGLTCNNEPVDVTDDNSSGWRELMAIPGLKTVEVPISGVLKNLELMRAFFNAQGGSQMFACVGTYPDGSTVTGDFFLATFNTTGESNVAIPFDSTWQSSGEIVFVAGTGAGS